MTVVRTIAEARERRRQEAQMALVPTMGALHPGHLSLIALAKQHAPAVSVSLFVNPTQFGPREDYNKYPRDLEQDLAKCEQAGAQWVFQPDEAEMYPPASADITIDLPEL